MNIEEIKTNMKNISDRSDELVLETYFVLKKGNEETFKRVDLEEEAQTKLKREFLQNLSNLIIHNEELGLQNVSEATNEENMLLYYDLEELDSLSMLNKLNENEDWETYSFDIDELSEVTGIIYLVHNDDQTLIAYKKTYPINLVRKDSRGVKIWKPRNSERFAEVTEDIYSIYPDMDLFMLNGEMYILNLKVLERFFDFHDVIVSSANDAINKIDDIGILVDTSVLQNIISEMSQARKLTQVGMHSPVFGKVKGEDIMEFVNKHPALTGKFKFNEDQTKIELDTKVSAKLFVKLLNDDYLLSELTELHYDTRAKSAVDNT